MSWDFYESKTVKARKPHRCEECGARIAPGERYYSYSGRYEGEFCHGKSCMACHTAAEFLFAQSPDFQYEGYIIGDLANTIMECCYNTAADAPARQHANGIIERNRIARTATSEHNGQD